MAVAAHRLSQPRDRLPAVTRTAPYTRRRESGSYSLLTRLAYNEARILSMPVALPSIRDTIA